MNDKIVFGDCLEVMKDLPDDCVDAFVTDPPYGLEFMGKQWDHGVPGVEFWREALRVAKPGAHLVAFGGTRTSHRLTCAIEDAGWEIRDSLIWLYGSGFPKSKDVALAIDKSEGLPNRGRAIPTASTHLPAGKYIEEKLTSNVVPAYEPVTDDAKKWKGWGTALKPAYEPIVLARKPLIGTVAANVLAHGTGAINVDACRVDVNGPRPAREYTGRSGNIYGNGLEGSRAIGETLQGRWPANIILDEEAGAILDAQTGTLTSGTNAVKRASSGTRAGNTSAAYGKESRADGELIPTYGDSGGASRFFYCAKSSRSERTHGGKVDNKHPTVKPVSLMRWLIKLVTPPGGSVLDPFCGSGTTLVAAELEGFDYMGIEQDPESHYTACQRLATTVRGTP